MRRGYRCTERWRHGAEKREAIAKRQKNRDREIETQKEAEKREFERYRQAEAETEVDREKIHRERWEYTERWEIDTERHKCKEQIK